MLQLFLFLSSLSLIIYLILKPSKSSNYWTSRGLPTIPFSIKTWQVLTGVKQQFDEDMDMYGRLNTKSLKYAGYMEFGHPVLFVKDLDLIKDILIKDFDHFVDRRESGNDPLFKDALFSMRGQEWRDMRNFLTPTFTSGRIRRMFPHFGTSSINLKKYILKQPGNQVNMSQVMRMYSLQVIGASAFGMDINLFEPGNERFMEMANRVGKFNVWRSIRIVLMQVFPKIAKILKLKFLDDEATNFFMDLILRSFKQREDSKEKRDDFLQLIVEAMKDQEDSGMKMDASLAVGQAAVFLIAGLDTVANNLAIACCLLAQHPEIQERLYGEVEEGKDIGYDAVNGMEYLDMVVSETLRLYPAVSRLERVCVKDYTIPGTKHVLPKGTIVAIPAEGVQRDEEHYPDPTKFDPNRFSQEEKAKRNPYAYMPFGNGLRNCIGMRFALMETKCALVHLVKTFEIKLPKNHVIKDEVVHEVFGYRTHPDLELVFLPRA